MIPRTWGQPFHGNTQHGRIDESARSFISEPGLGLSISHAMWFAEAYPPFPVLECTCCYTCAAVGTRCSRPTNKRHVLS